LGVIILPGESDPFAATFADDHYLPDLKHEHVKVVAQLPEWVNVRWYHDLVRRVGHEVKGAWVVGNWNSLGSDLRDSIERSTREALITISDSTLDRLEIQAELENRVTKRPLATLSQPVRQKMEAILDEHVEIGVLFDSPGYDALRYVEGDDFDVRKLHRKLGNAHNVRLFSARAAAALAEYLDPERRKAMIQTLIDRRYFLPDELTALFMADAVAPHRTFDQGNSKVFDMIRNMLEGVADRIRNNEQLHFIMPAGAGGATEADSKQVPHVAAADIASRMAGDLYRSNDGLRRVVGRFRIVILNGAVVRF
jgi:hypothetical protein